ncbi:MAG: hypothetical protein MHM6MM_006874 [Cercozoa sp. M6MM]
MQQQQEHVLRNLAKLVDSIAAEQSDLNGRQLRLSEQEFQRALSLSSALLSARVATLSDENDMDSAVHAVLRETRSDPAVYRVGHTYPLPSTPS